MIPLGPRSDLRGVGGMTVGLIVANLAVFLIQVSLPPEQLEAFVLHAALAPARYTDPVFAATNGLDPTNPLPFITHAFMHVGWPHLLVNMWTLWIFGRPLEARLGVARLCLLYLLCGFAGGGVHLASDPFSPIPALGASGAVAGLIGAYTLLRPTARMVVVMPIGFIPIPLTVPLVLYSALWFLFQLFPGLAALFAPEPASGIAWWAHIGGFVAGLLLVKGLGEVRVDDRVIGPERPDILAVGPERRGLISSADGDRLVAQHGPAETAVEATAPAPRPSPGRVAQREPRTERKPPRRRSEPPRTGPARGREAPTTPGPWGTRPRVAAASVGGAAAHEISQAAQLVIEALKLRGQGPAAPTTIPNSGPSRRTAHMPERRTRFGPWGHRRE